MIIVKIELISVFGLYLTYLVDLKTDDDVETDEEDEEDDDEVSDGIILCCIE